MPGLVLGCVDRAVWKACHGCLRPKFLLLQIRCEESLRIKMAFFKAMLVVGNCSVPESLAVANLLNHIEFQ